MKSIKIAVFIFLYFVFLFCFKILAAQSPDSIYVNNIKTVRLYNYGNQLSLPVINLNSNDQVELHFDDMDADVKYYYYTYQLCNNDWTPVNLSQFDYIKGIYTDANYQLPVFINCAYKVHTLPGCNSRQELLSYPFRKLFA